MVYGLAMFKNASKSTIAHINLMRSSMNSRLFLITFVAAISVLVAKVEANDEKALPRNELAYRLLQRLFPNEVNSFDSLKHLTTEQEIFYAQLLDLRYSEQQSLYYSMNDSNNEVRDRQRLSALIFCGHCQRELRELFYEQEPSLRRTFSEMLRFLVVVQQRLRDSIMHQKQWAERETEAIFYACNSLTEELKYSERHEGQLRTENLASLRMRLERLNDLLQ